jgi:hypothetical protein
MKLTCTLPSPDRAFMSFVTFFSNSVSSASEDCSLSTSLGSSVRGAVGAAPAGAVGEFNIQSTSVHNAVGLAERSTETTATNTTHARATSARAAARNTPFAGAAGAPPSRRMLPYCIL